MRKVIFFILDLNNPFGGDPGHVVHNCLHVEQAKPLEECHMMGTESLCKLGAEDLPPRALVVQDDQGVGRQRLEVAKVQLLSHLFLLYSSCSAFLSFSFPLGNLFFLLRLIEDDLPSLLVVRVRVDISQDFPDRAADALNRASQGKPMEQFSWTKKKADLSPVKFASFFKLCIFILMLNIFQNTGPGCKSVGGGNIHKKRGKPHL